MQILKLVALAIVSILAPSLAYALSAPHEGWDELWRDLMIDIFVLGGAFATITLYFLIRYRRKSPNEKGSAPKLSPIAAFGWVLIPLFVFMADDIFLGLKNWDLWDEYRTIPKDAYTVDVNTYMWGYEVRYPEGITTRNELRVPVGKPIHVKLTSSDVIHTFFLPDFRVKWDALPGRVQSLWFYPKEVGEHVFTCTEFCGLLHSKMFGKLLVMKEDDFSKWLAEQQPMTGNQPSGENPPQEENNS